MKHSSSLQHFKKFVYVDSSEEEEERQRLPLTQKGETNPKIIASIEREAKDNSYKQELKHLIQSQIDKIEGGRVLMVGANDKIVEQNFKMRKQKYQYFVEQMEIDERYNKITSEKVSRLKEENKRKKEVLDRKRKEEQMKDEECMLKKYIIEKKSKQERVIDGVKKITHKLGVERNIHTIKHVKTQIQTEKELTEHQLQNLKSKQKNQLDELRQKYEELKNEKLLNKKDQQKVLLALQKQNLQQRQQLKQQLLIKKTFEV